jgi:hypothetical protein
MLAFKVFLSTEVLHLVNLDLFATLQETSFNLTAIEP